MTARRILLVHGNLRAGGGAEVYANAILGWLKRRGTPPDLLDIHGWRGPGAGTLPLRARAWLALGRVAGGRHLLRYALVCRVLPLLTARYDALILSYGEGPPLRLPTVTIRHAPALFSTHPAMLAALGPSSRWRAPYTICCRAIARAGPGSSRIAAKSAVAPLELANSRWTAQHMARHLNLPEPPVLYPPVKARARRNLPRDPHLILSLGRIVPGKRLEEAVEVLDGLRRAGLPARLAIVGRAEGAYAQRLLRRWRNRPGLLLYPNASDVQLERLLARASFGLHCYRQEHFGIAVAEMICAGILPMVHDDGGVAELVTEPLLRFDGVGCATAQLARLMSCHEQERAATSDRLQRGEALGRALNFEGELEAALAPLLNQELDAA
jgi:glycosyltransferase involved in cell wall biosynthesis